MGSTLLLLHFLFSNTRAIFNFNTAHHSKPRLQPNRPWMGRHTPGANVFAFLLGLIFVVVTGAFPTTSIISNSIMLRRTALGHPTQMRRIRVSAFLSARAARTTPLTCRGGSSYAKTFMTMAAQGAAAGGVQYDVIVVGGYVCGR